MHVIRIHGALRHTGLKPRRTAPGQSRFPTLKAAQIKVLPRDQWRPIDMSRKNPGEVDQDGRNACASAAAVEALHLARAAAGLPFVRLSQGSLYARVCGGQDDGSTLEDNLAELTDRGICLASTVDPLIYRLADLPNNWTTEAANYRITEAWDCPDFPSLATAQTNGDPTVFGIMVGNNFEPNNEGWINFEKGNGGHGLCGEGLYARPLRGTRAYTIPEHHPEFFAAILEAIRSDDVSWAIRTPNTWKGWGIQDKRGKRFGYVPEAYFTRTPFTDGWAIRVVTQVRGK